MPITLAEFGNKGGSHTIKYLCSFCGEQYRTLQKAQTCEDFGYTFDPGVALGAVFRAWRHKQFDYAHDRTNPIFRGATLGVIVLLENIGMRFDDGNFVDYKSRRDLPFQSLDVPFRGHYPRMCFLDATISLTTRTLLALDVPGREYHQSDGTTFYAVSSRRIQSLQQISARRYGFVEEILARNSPGLVEFGCNPADIYRGDRIAFHPPENIRKNWRKIETLEDQLEVATILGDSEATLRLQAELQLLRT